MWAKSSRTRSLASVSLGLVLALRLPLEQRRPHATLRVVAGVRCVLTRPKYRASQGWWTAMGMDMMTIMLLHFRSLEHPDQQSFALPCMAAACVKGHTPGKEANGIGIVHTPGDHSHQINPGYPVYAH